MSQMNLGSRKGDWKMTRYFNTEGTRDAVEQSAFEKIYEVVRQIPYGQVATYGQVAALAGNNRWARVVG